MGDFLDTYLILDLSNLLDSSLLYVSDLAGCFPWHFGELLWAGFGYTWTYIPDDNSISPITDTQVRNTTQQNMRCSFSLLLWTATAVSK